MAKQNKQQTPKNEDIVATLEAEFSKCKEKQFKVYFFVMDTKGAPSGELTYIYETAMHLYKNGYDVHFLHSEQEFVGVGEWLGEEYAVLPHHYIEKDKVDVSPSDFLFIPEVFSSVMAQTKKLPCRRIVIAYNYDLFCENIPFAATLEDLGIRECVTTTNTFKDKLQRLFPTLRISVVNPAVRDDIFTKPTEEKKLIINVVAKDMNALNTIVKTFMWKYPIYKWVSFRNVGNIERHEFADLLKESIITVWSDSTTNFGYSPLEAMACGNIVIGKVPENKSEWMQADDGTLLDNGIWAYTYDDCVDMIARAVQTYLYDSVPSAITENAATTASKYSVENFEKGVEDVYVNGFFEQRKKEIEIALGSYRNYLEKKEGEQQK